MNALVFPGQGSQKVGMAKLMVQTQTWAARLVEQADRILQRPLSKIIFEGPESELKSTVNTQPALFLTSAILTEAVKQAGFTYSAVAGHSLGEYSALYAAGAAGFEDLLRLVDARARAMESACPAGQGAMAAVLMLDRPVIEEICREAAAFGPCVLANINCPGQVVISGAAPAVAKASELAKARGAKRVMPLEVSGPFHSPLMEPARQRLEEAMSGVGFRDTTVAVYANVTARATRSAAEFQANLLDQLTGSVRWEDLIRTMYADGFRQFVELGPGKVLSGLIKKIAPEARLAQAEDPETLKALVSGGQTGAAGA